MCMPQKKKKKHRPFSHVTLTLSHCVHDCRPKHLLYCMGGIGMDGIMLWNTVKHLMWSSLPSSLCVIIHGVRCVDWYPFISVHLTQRLMDVFSTKIGWFIIIYYYLVGMLQSAQNKNGEYRQKWSEQVATSGVKCHRKEWSWTAWTGFINGWLTFGLTFGNADIASSSEWPPLVMQLVTS